MSGHTAERITLARLPSGVRIETTLHTYGDGDGPTVYVQAAQHGREVNGAAVLRRIHDRLDPADVSGTLLAVPVANPLTFDRVSYTTTEPLDSVNPNMNRVWPGDETGTLHERMAARLWSLASEADAIVDLHTASRDSLTHVVFREDDDASRSLAEAFGTDLLLAELADDDADEEWHARDFGGKLRVAASAEGIPSITPELDHNKEIVEAAVEAGVAGTLDVLRELDVLPEPPDDEAVPPLYRNHLGRVTATDSGLFRVDPGVEVGQEVEAGEHVGTLYDPTSYETLQEVETDRAGLLYSVTRESTVTAGDSLVNVALPLED
jgi:predicted deacylase